ncbi:MAG: response regulator [Sporosarcina sp.]
MRYFIVDDDMASRRMLGRIIMEGELGVVIGEAESGVKALSPILASYPDTVLIDLLMPGMDGIETMEQLKAQGFLGQFIMISQIVNKEMVGEAYEKGVEFFIHKPINRVEVHSILKKIEEKSRLKDSLIAIRDSLVHIEPDVKSAKQRNVKEIVSTILNDMGIIGEAGSDDIVSLIEILMSQGDGFTQLQPLKELYGAVASKRGNVEITKESKAIEQRIRRTILAAVNHMASLGAVDYTTSEFEYYAPRYFDFQEIRSRMKQIQEDHHEPVKVKVNIKKFIQVLFLETRDKYVQS